MLSAVMIVLCASAFVFRDLFLHRFTSPRKLKMQVISMFRGAEVPKTRADETRTGEGGGVI